LRASKKTDFIIAANKADNEDMILEAYSQAGQ